MSEVIKVFCTRTWRGSPIVNRPSPDELHHAVRLFCFFSPICDTWHIRGGGYPLQNVRSPDLKIFTKDELFTLLMNGRRCYTLALKCKKVYTNKQTNSNPSLKDKCETDVQPVRSPISVTMWSQSLGDKWSTLDLQVQVWHTVPWGQVRARPSKSSLDCGSSITS